LNSMTGFGRAVIECDDRKISVELKSVNHRYLDISIRLPRTISFLEDVVRTCLKERLERGHVDVYIYYTNTRNDAHVLSMDDGLASAYVAMMLDAAEKYDIPYDLTVTSLSRLPDVVTVTEADEDEEALLGMMKQAMNEAIDNLLAMRSAEGAGMWRDISGRLDAMQELVAGVEERSPQMVKEYQSKLTARIEALLGETQVDEARIATEVAFFADKCCIDEETVRLREHIAHMRKLAAGTDAVGRKLDFLVQEMNREVNTICSKANDMSITETGLELKSIIEKIREQVQNLE